MPHDVELSKTIELDGFVYLINHPQVEEAWDIGIELSKLIAVPAATMASAGGSEEKAGKLISVAVQGMMQNVDGKSSMLLIKRLFKNVEVQGKVGGETKKFLLDEAGIRRHFHANMGSMIRLFSEVVAFTHRDFFAAIKEMIAKVMAD